MTEVRRQQPKFAPGGQPSPTRALADQLHSLINLGALLSYHLIPQISQLHSNDHLHRDAEQFQGAEMVKVMKANGIADSDEEAINLGNMLLRYGLIEARAKDAGIFRNNKTTYVIARAGRSTAVDGVVPKSTSALAIDQHAFMEARTHFLERFELEHEITENGELVKFCSGSEVVAWLLANTTLVRYAHAEAMGAHLLQTRQLAPLDSREVNELFRYNSRYTWGPANRRSALSENGPRGTFVKDTEVTPIFQADHPGGLSLFGLDPVYTNMLLYMLGGYLLFEIMVGSY